MNNELKFEIIVNGEEVEITENEVIQEIKRILDNNFMSRDSDGNYFDEVYLDYRDELSEETIENIVTAEGNKKERFYDEVTEMMIDCEADFYIINHAKELVEEGWDYEKMGDHYEYEDFINDWFLENFYVSIPYDHFLKQEVLVNVVVDTGDGNYDYTLNSFLTNDEDEIEEESSILWLVKQQGYSKADLLDAINNGTENQFLNSIIDELLNASTHMNALTFCIGMTLEEFLDFEDSKEDVIVNTRVDCGLVDFWSGAGSMIEVITESPVVIPRKFIQAHIDGTRGYSIQDIYGVSSSLWKNNN